MLTEGVTDNHGGENWADHTLPHLGQSPLMTNSASSLASSPAAPSPFKRLEARVGCWGSLGLRCSRFLVGGLYAHGMRLMIHEKASPTCDFGTTWRTLLDL